MASVQGEGGPGLDGREEDEGEELPKESGGGCRQQGEEKPPAKEEQPRAMKDQGDEGTGWEALIKQKKEDTQGKKSRKGRPSPPR